MLKTEQGFLFDSSAHVIVNPTNTTGIFHGLESQYIKAHYPHVYRKYRNACIKKEFSIGRLQMIRISDDQFIMNMPVYGYDQVELKIDDLQLACEKLEQTAKLRHFKSIAIPDVTINLNPKEKQRVQAIYQSYLEPLSIPITIYQTKW